MKISALIIALVSFLYATAQAQHKSTAREYSKTFTTYPFSDPDPIPEVGKIYPYFRFDGYTDDPVQKEWKVVELENDYIKVMILPEIGGKIWTAIEKSTGKPFLYYNHVVKFRDIAMRGPWTSGGVEANYGIIGHTPNVATPVDYRIINRPDGSVSCVIGVLDLLTRTTWRIDINLPEDKAYFTTRSLWYNASPVEQPYYSWMNAAIKAGDDLQFVFPGTKYIGHGGDYHDWPVNPENGKNISFYRNNDFGGSKSYHVFGKYTGFYGGYWHDEDFGMGRYAPYDDKPGKKLWIWGLSQQGMIWEKLLTDTDGQYVEVQSGRLFNQTAGQSTFTPFKHKGFLPYVTDVWKEYWFPVVKTKGFVVANNYGALNFKKSNGWLKIYLSPLQQIADTLKITSGSKVIYSKMLRLNTLELFTDSVQLDSDAAEWAAALGENKLAYNAAPGAKVLARPVQTPADFDWSSAYGLYIQGKENIRERDYAEAEKNLSACLQKEPYYAPALTALSMVSFRDMRYPKALELAKTALSVNTYDPAANYYYGLANAKLGNIADAKDGFSIAAMGIAYRSAAYTELAKLFFREGDRAKAAAYARQSIDYNQYAMDAYRLLAVIYRMQGEASQAENITDTLLLYDPLDHFAQFEKYLRQPSGENKMAFTGMIRNEMPDQTYLELATWYYNAGCNEEAAKVLQLSPPTAETVYWLALLEHKPLDNAKLDPAFVFPFRPETAEILEQLILHNDYWLLKYHLALIQWNCNNRDSAEALFAACGDEPHYAPFYAARAELRQQQGGREADVLADLQKAAQLDGDQWRYGRSLAGYYVDQKQPEKALAVAKKYHEQFPSNYLVGMLYVKTLLLNKQYEAADDILRDIKILPNEGATSGRRLYKETHLMLALKEMNRKNYRKALSEIAAARLWPESLGVGKPYESNIDERLENWLAYTCYIKRSDKTAAAQMLDKILSYGRDEDGAYHLSPSANNLVTARAMQRAGKPEQAEAFLQQELDSHPGNALAQWALDVYKGKQAALPDDSRTDENYRILQSLITIPGK